jgi:hypothetical protein
VWGIDGTKTIGVKAATRDDALAGFRKAWDAMKNVHRAG